MFKKIILAVVMALPVFIAAADDNQTVFFGAAYFETDNPNPTVETRTLVVRVFREMDVPGCANIMLVGYGCDADKPERNEAIGMRRAGIIRDMLVQKGFSFDRIGMKSMGIMCPIHAGMTTHADRRYNSAVEIFIQPQKNWYDDFRCKQLLGY